MVFITVCNAAAYYYIMYVYGSPNMEVILLTSTSVKYLRYDNNCSNAEPTGFSFNNLLKFWLAALGVLSGKYSSASSLREYDFNSNMIGVSTKISASLFQWLDCLIY